MNRRNFNLVLFILVGGILYTREIENIGLSARSGEWQKEYCIRPIINSGVGKLPKLNSVNYSKLKILPNDTNACKINSLRRFNISGAITIIPYNRSCYFTTQAHNVETLKAKIVGFDLEKMMDVEFDHTIALVTIPGFLIKNSTVSEILKHEEVEAGIFELNKVALLDPIIVVVMATAIFAICLGVLWGMELFMKSIVVKPPLREGEKKQPKEAKEPPVLSLSYIALAFSFAFIVGFLILAYFYTHIIKYFVLVCYILMSLNSLTLCIMRLLKFLPKKFVENALKKKLNTERKYLPAFNVNFTISFFLALCIVVTYTTLKTKSERLWVMQNLIGFSICVVFISIYRVRNLKLVTIIMTFFFLYDIFFVFVTPYIKIFDKGLSTTGTTVIKPTTSRAPTNFTTLVMTTHLIPITKPTLPPSVMEYVAVGLGTGDALPIVFKYPHIIKEKNPCLDGPPYSLLGLGDVLIPGIIGMYCAVYDLAKNNRPISLYFLIFIISYTLGLVFTYIALIFMNMAQPALLYIIPSTLLSIYLTSTARYEFKDFFYGISIQQFIRRKQMLSDEE